MVAASVFDPFALAALLGPLGALPAPLVLPLLELLLPSRLPLLLTLAVFCVDACDVAVCVLHILAGVAGRVPLGGGGGGGGVVPAIAAVAVVVVEVVGVAACGAAVTTRCTAGAGATLAGPARVLPVPLMVVLMTHTPDNNKHNIVKYF